jgi:hypothetical protein
MDGHIKEISLKSLIQPVALNSFHGNLLKRASTNP